MDKQQIQIYLNERSLTVASGTFLRELHQHQCPDADLLIVNGYPCPDDHLMADQDHIVMIRRGVAPSPQELEALMMARHTPGVHAQVKKARVGIAGAGGLGSAIAIALARTGVGFIRIGGQKLKFSVKLGGTMIYKFTNTNRSLPYSYINLGLGINYRL